MCRFISFYTLILIMLASCAAPSMQPDSITNNSGDPAAVITPQAYLPNPASVYCEQQGNKLEIRSASDGSQNGVCILPDGSECDEWLFYRGECQSSHPQNTPQATITPILDNDSTEAVELASDGCKLYRNAEFGYSFHYPGDANLVANDDPLHGISIVGPEKDNEIWPSISISHPLDREEYRPVEDVDLLTWLTDHNLLGDERAADVPIAGVTAIHLRHARSPQSYAFDRYYFAKSGQLFMIVIGHTGDKEDWNLYNHFLNSIQFEP